MTTKMKSAAMLPREKRAWRPWYSFSEWAVCYFCRVPGIVKHTDTADDGEKIQRRYCPQCHRSFKTRYRPELPEANS